VHGPDLTLSTFAQLARDGDLACTRFLMDAARPLAVALMNGIILVTPGIVVLGGELSAAGDALLGPVLRAIRSTSSPRYWTGRVVLAELGEDAVALGAGLAAAGRVEYLV
jgi:predicted NBD/HSP70 family sugar kinase